MIWVVPYCQAGVNTKDSDFRFFFSLTPFSAFPYKDASKHSTQGLATMDSHVISLLPSIADSVPHVGTLQGWLIFGGVVIILLTLRRAKLI